MNQGGATPPAEKQAGSITMPNNELPAVKKAASL